MCLSLLNFLGHVVVGAEVGQPGVGAVPVVLAPERLKQEDHGFKNKLGHKVTPCLEGIFFILKKLTMSYVDTNCLN